MTITLIKCDPEQRSTCKSDKEIAEYLRDKYIVVLENNYNFKQQNYEETKRVESLAKMLFFPLNANNEIEQSRMVHAFSVTF